MIELRCILDRMKELDNYWDTEAAHAEADDLLVKALLVISECTGDEDLCKNIVESYERVDKWYA